MTVQLDCLHARLRNNVKDSIREIVLENSDSQDFGRQTSRDVVDNLSRHLTGRRREYETDGVGSHSYSEKRIIFIRDATNFHEHDDTVPPDSETTADT